MIVKTVFIVKKEQLPIEENVNIVRWIVKIYKVNHHNIEKKTNKTTVLLVKYGGDTMENMILEYCRNNLTRFSTMTDVEIYNWMCDNFCTKDYEMVRKCSRIIFDESR